MLIFLALIVVVCCVRAPAFFWSVINWDESIYLLISRSMLDGNVLYTDIWDRKQPLTFVLFAVAQWVFGESLMAVRLLGCVAVATTCLGLFLVGRRTFGENGLGAAAAAGLYAVFSVSSGGLATNTEILFAPFAVFAATLILPWWVGEGTEGAPSNAACAGAGLLIGFATLIKLIAIFDGGFVGLLVVAGWLASRRDPNRRLSVGWLARRAGAMITGALIPWLVTTGYFWLAGAVDDFVFANFTFNRMNLVDRPPFSLTNVWLVAVRLVTSENGLLWLAMVVGIVWLIVRPGWLSRNDRRLLAALVVWAVMGAMGAISLRHLYLHYYLQPTPALALIGGLVGARLWRLSPRLPTLIKVGVVALLLVPQASRIAERWRQIGTMVDVPAAVADYLGERVRPGEYIYVANYQPIIYFITETRSPTRWAFPQFLISPVFRQRLGIDLEEEMAAIFSHAPTYVVVNTEESELADPAYYRVLIEEHLDVDYVLETQLASIALFRRRVESDQPRPAVGPPSQRVDPNPD